MKPTSSERTENVLELSKGFVIAGGLTLLALALGLLALGYWLGQSRSSTKSRARGGSTSSSQGGALTPVSSPKKKKQFSKAAKGAVDSGTASPATPSGGTVEDSDSSEDSSLVPDSAYSTAKVFPSFSSTPSQPVAPKSADKSETQKHAVDAAPTSTAVSVVTDVDVDEGLFIGAGSKKKKKKAAAGPQPKGQQGIPTPVSPAVAHTQAPAPAAAAAAAVAAAAAAAAAAEFVLAATPAPAVVFSAAVSAVSSSSKLPSTPAAALGPGPSLQSLSSPSLDEFLSNEAVAAAAAEEIEARRAKEREAEAGTWETVDKDKNKAKSRKAESSVPATTADDAIGSKKLGKTADNTGGSDPEGSTRRPGSPRPGHGQAPGGDKARSKSKDKGAGKDKDKEIADQSSDSSLAGSPSPTPPPEMSTAVLTIDATRLGHLIGPGGKTRSAIKEKTGTQVSMPRTEKDAKGPVDVTVTGPPDGVARAIKALQELNEKGYALLLEGDDFVETSVQINAMYVLAVPWPC